jgi:hypothetical protein
MSDLNAVRQKVQEGADWRGEINVSIDGDELQLTVRQLKDPEFFEVMSLIDRDELQELRSTLPSDKMDEYQDLQETEELDDEEADRLNELKEELESSDIDMFDVLSQETFEGIRKCAKYAVEPDDEDIREAFMERAADIEREYGVKVQEPADVMPALQDDIEHMIDNSTKLTSFTIGIQALVQTVGESEGNLENLPNPDTDKKSTD